MDYQVANTYNVFDVVYCSDVGSQFWFFTGDNPDNVLDQGYHEWGLVRLNRPAGQTYAAGASEWVLLYWVPDSTGDADARYTNTYFRCVTMGIGAGDLSTANKDQELPQSFSSGYLMRNQAVYSNGGLVGYLPDTIGLHYQYDSRDEMTDTNGDVWTKVGRTVWVKDL